MTEFAMVEELACLVKDNLPCKHLVLSMEEALVNFLQDDTSPDGLMELEPMNPYNRLLLHRLADIFGFAHESVGEGDERHLILERCSETSIPSILVSDLLWQYDESESPVASHQLLRRIDASSPVVHSKTHKYTLEEREAAYLAARERIFATDEGEMRESVRQKPRTDPVVARRMIVHALGQRAKMLNLDSALPDNKSDKGPSAKHNIKEEKVCTSRGEAQRKVDCSSGQNVNIFKKTNSRDDDPATGSSHDNTDKERQNNKLSNSSMLQNEKSMPISKERVKVENLGAAKRMFAIALGLPSTKEGLHPKKETLHDCGKNL
ncbi:unnamed protein product [Rhodiola kirilowii]